jgi:hypothetical protein
VGAILAVHPIDKVTIQPAAFAAKFYLCKATNVIIRHLHGNMLSRWTHFLTEDGEKEGRNRDAEFSPPAFGKSALLALWEERWDCLLTTLRSLKEEDLLKTITIRCEPLNVIDAINRQLAHYPHQFGQIVYIGEMIRIEKWQSLSIPKGVSGEFNQRMKEEQSGRDSASGVAPCFFGLAQKR